jgi:hypothetical protein
MRGTAVYAEDSMNDFADVGHLMCITPVAMVVSITVLSKDGYSIYYDPMLQVYHMARHVKRLSKL